MTDRYRNITTEFLSQNITQEEATYSNDLDLPISNSVIFIIKFEMFNMFQKQMVVNQAINHVSRTFCTCFTFKDDSLNE